MNRMQNPTETAQLSRLIQQKHGLLVQLRDLARKQLSLVDAGDMTALLRLLATKQNLLAEVQQVEQELDPFRQQEPESRVWRDPSVRQRTALLADECTGLLQNTFDLETQAESALSSHCDATAKRVQTATCATHDRHAYVLKSTTRTSSIDLCSE